MCLDNADMVIEHDKDEFVNFLTQMYDECPNLNIIVTSSRGFDYCLPNDVILKPQLLHSLKMIDSV